MYTYEEVYMIGRYFYLVYFKDYYLRSFYTEQEAIDYCNSNNK